MALSDRITALTLAIANAMNARYPKPGASAYDLAVLNGFSGTQAQYLAQQDRTAANLTALAGMLANTPEGGIAVVGRYLVTGSLYHQQSVWIKDNGKWSLAYGTSIHVFGEAAGAIAGIKDLITFGNAIDSTRSNNASAFNGYSGERITSGQSLEVRKQNGVGWIGWASGFDDAAHTLGGITLGSGGTDVLKARYVEGEMLFDGVITLGSGGQVTGIIQWDFTNSGLVAVNSRGTISAGGIGYEDVGNASIPGLLTIANKSFIGRAIRTDQTYATEANTSSTIPFAWGQGDRIHLRVLVSQF